MKACFIICIVALFMGCPTAQKNISNEEGEFYEFPTDKSPEYAEIKDNLYRNTKYKFRIKFPVDWKILPGVGSNVVVKAVHSGRTISVVVKQISLDDPELTIADVYDDFNLYVDAQLVALKNKFPETHIISSRILKVDNRLAYSFKYSTKYKARAPNATGINVQIFYRGIFYTITTVGLEKDFDNIEEIVNNTISTFVIEDF